MTTRPLVQDFTDRRSRLMVHVAAAEAYEMLISLFVHTGDCIDDEYPAAEGIGRAVEQHGSAELRHALDDLRQRGWGTVWLSLVGIVHGDPGVATIPGMIDVVRSADPIAVRRGMLEACGCSPSHGFPTDLVDRAAAGEERAVSELLDSSLGSLDEHLDRTDEVLLSVLQQDPERTRDHVVSILERFHAEVWPNLQTPPMAIIERDAADKRSLARSMSPEALVEKATNGVTFDRQAWMTDVVLIPTVAARPWVLIADQGSTRIFCYPISEERLAADPSAPPDHLIEVFKALGDEKRLRILAALAGGTSQLTDIAEQVDVAKSTAHHHLRVLRAAGLVRAVVSEGGSRYELRRQSIPELGYLLEAYLPGGAPIPEQAGNR